MTDGYKNLVWFDHTPLKYGNAVFQSLLLQVGIIKEETLFFKRDSPLLV